MCYNFDCKVKNLTTEWGITMPKNLKVAELLDIYGNLLNEKQRTSLEFYYYEDLSLSEIAENIGVSRQGVRDVIKRAENFLFFAEQELKLLQKRESFIEVIELLKQQDVNNEVKELVSKLENLTKES